MPSFAVPATLSYCPYVPNPTLATLMDIPSGHLILLRPVKAFTLCLTKYSQDIYLCLNSAAVCLSAVVGGMLCKSDKPSIIIIIKLSRHRVKWLGHAARKPETTIVNQLLHADSIPGRPRPVGRPHYTWKDGAMQDLNALGPRLSWTSSETGRSWRWTGSCGGGLQAGASLVGAL